MGGFGSSGLMIQIDFNTTQSISLGLAFQEGLKSLQQVHGKS